MSQFTRHVITGLGMVCLSLPSFAQLKSAYVAPRQYECYQTAAPLKIDGLPDEAAWKNVPWTDYFRDIEGDKQPEPALHTRLKMLWDKDYLYVAAEMEEPGIWATLHQHDTIIYQDNDFELFIDPDNDTHQYFEIEINPNNTVMDLFMGKPYRDGGDALMNWDTKGMRTAVHIDGTLNKPGDKDKNWTVEMAIPFSAFSFFNEQLTPHDSGFWRINFSRVEWDTDVVNGQYIKRRNPATGKILPEHNWVWSPQGIINMHAPEKWGYLFFVQQPAGSNNVTLHPPAIEAAKDYLWQVYALQRQYRHAHGGYASNLATLGITDITVNAAGIHYTLQMEGITDQFTATINDTNGAASYAINQDGKISQKLLK